MGTFGSAYEIVDKPGSSALFEIYTARNVDNGEMVTIRVLLEQAMGHHQERFVNEMQVWSKLHHKNIVPLLEVGEHEGHPFCVEGRAGASTLRDCLNANLSLLDGLELIKKCCDGLAFAHENGIIHRDIKPEEIYLTKDGAVLLGGFGLAQSEEDDSGLTKTGVIVGTPSYLAPERILSDNFDTAVDVYAIGVILYKLIMDKPPFVGNTPDILRGHLKIKPSLPVDTFPELASIVEQLLEKEPQNRPSAKNLSKALSRISKTLSTQSDRSKPALTPPKKQGRPYAAILSIGFLSLTLLFLFCNQSPHTTETPRPKTVTKTAFERNDDEQVKELLLKRRAIFEQVKALHLEKAQAINIDDEISSSCRSFLTFIDRLAKLPPLPPEKRFVEGASLTHICGHFLVSVGLRGLQSEGATIGERNYPYDYYADFTILGERLVKTRIPAILEKTLGKTIERTALCSSRHVHLRLLNAIARAYTFQRPEEKKAIRQLDKMEERYGHEAIDASEKGREWLIFLLYHAAFYRHVFSLLDDSEEISNGILATISKVDRLAPPLAEELPLSFLDQYCIHTRMLWLHRNRLHDEIADVSLSLRAPGKTPALKEAISYGGKIMAMYNGKAYVDAVHRLVLFELSKRDKEAAEGLRKKWAHLLEGE